MRYRFGTWKRGLVAKGEAWMYPVGRVYEHVLCGANLWTKDMARLRVDDKICTETEMSSMPCMSRSLFPCQGTTRQSLGRPRLRQHLQPSLWMTLGGTPQHDKYLIDTCVLVHRSHHQIAHEASCKKMDSSVILNIFRPGIKKTAIYPDCCITPWIQQGRWINVASHLRCVTGLDKWSFVKLSEKKNVSLIINHWWCQCSEWLLITLFTKTIYGPPLLLWRKSVTSRFITRPHNPVTCHNWPELKFCRLVKFCCGLLWFVVVWYHRFYPYPLRLHHLYWANREIGRSERQS